MAYKPINKKPHCFSLFGISINNYLFTVWYYFSSNLYLLHLDKSYGE